MGASCSPTTSSLVTVVAPPFFNLRALSSRSRLADLDLACVGRVEGVRGEDHEWG